MKYKFFYSVCFLFFGIITLMTSTSSVKAVEGTCHEINGKIAFNVEEDALVSHAGGDYRRLINIIEFIFSGKNVDYDSIYNNIETTI